MEAAIIVIAILGVAVFVFMTFFKYFKDIFRF